ncbi:hypothetical protein MMC07_008223 [Pseudocyphellaria aurata]|nr:hypothetical protein [Pseudocyphellaria aurata]
MPPLSRSHYYILQLRCHHPAADYTRGGEYYDYLGTLGLSRAGHAGASPTSDDVAGGGLRGLYSRFSPAQCDEQKWGVGRIINLDGHELFSQLCTSLTLTKIVRCDHVYVQENRTVRLWRDWLAQCASCPIDLIRDGASVERSRSSSQERSPFSGELDRTIWTDQDQNVGLRVRVHDRKSSLEERHDRFQDADEDQPVSYDLDIRELIIRSIFLLDGLEKLSVSNKDWTRMAIIVRYRTQNIN